MESKGFPPPPSAVRLAHAISQRITKGDSKSDAMRDAIHILGLVGDDHVVRKDAITGPEAELMFMLEKEKLLEPVVERFWWFRKLVGWCWTDSRTW